jgi:AcrR family transcriptional regulator
MELENRKPGREEQTDRRTRRTRTALLRALEHLLAIRQFDQISIRDIAAEADIAYPTFYRHYPDRESLLSDLAADEISALLDLTLPLFTAQESYASSLALCEHVRRHERLWAVLLTGGAAANVRALFVAQTERRAEQWPPRNDWLPADVGTAILCGATLEVLAWWLGKTRHKPSEEVARILSRFFAQAIA